jgi:hypothetical protein
VGADSVWWEASVVKVQVNATLFEGIVYVQDMQGYAQGAAGDVECSDDFVVWFRMMCKAQVNCEVFEGITMVCLVSNWSNKLFSLLFYSYSMW